MSLFNSRMEYCLCTGQPTPIGSPRNFQQLTDYVSMVDVFKKIIGAQIFKNKPI